MCNLWSPWGRSCSDLFRSLAVACCQEPREKCWPQAKEEATRLGARKACLYQTRDRIRGHQLDDIKNFCLTFFVPVIKHSSLWFRRSTGGVLTGWLWVGLCPRSYPRSPARFGAQEAKKDPRAQQAGNPCVQFRGILHGSGKTAFSGHRLGVLVHAPGPGGSGGAARWCVTWP